MTVDNDFMKSYLEYKDFWKKVRLGAATLLGTLLGLFAGHLCLANMINYLRLSHTTPYNPIASALVLAGFTALMAIAFVSRFGLRLRRVKEIAFERKLFWRYCITAVIAFGLALYSNPHPFVL